MKRGEGRGERRGGESAGKSENGRQRVEKRNIVVKGDIVWGSSTGVYSALESLRV